MRKREHLTCEICHSDYQYTGDHISRYSDNSIKVCPTCKETLPGDGRNILRCKACNSPFKTDGNTDYCPSCSKERSVFTCELCNNNYEYTGDDLVKYIDKGIKVCPTCKGILPGEGRWVLRCKGCNSPFKGNNSRINYCNICNSNIREFICEICNSEYRYTGDKPEKYIDRGIRVCPECEKILPGTGSKILRCDTCNSPFKAKAGNVSCCPGCSSGGEEGDV